MKQLFAIALLASSILFTSCGGGSMVDQFAACQCESVTAVTKLKTEMEAATDDAKKTEIMTKLKAASQPACMMDLFAKIEKMPKEEQDKMEPLVKAAVEKKCGDAMKSMDKK